MLFEEALKQWVEEINKQHFSDASLASTDEVRAAIEKYRQRQGEDYINLFFKDDLGQWRHRLEHLDITELIKLIEVERQQLS